MIRTARCVLLLLGGLLVAVGATPPAPIAVVTDLRGDVKLRRAGENQAQPLGQTTFLDAGDQLQTGADGRATMFQLQAPVTIAGPNQTLTLQAVPPSPRPDALSPDLFQLLEKQFAATSRSARAPSPLARRTVGDLVVTALAPRHSLVLDARPTFEWTQVLDATSYTLTLYDRADRILWETTTRETRVAYPAGRKPLAPGDYAWEVLARGASRQGLDTAPFTVPTAREAAAARRVRERARRLVTGSEATPLPYLAVCLEYRLYPEAESVLEQAAARAPHDPVLAEVRMRLYQLTGRWEEREQARPIRVPAELRPAPEGGAR